MCSCAAFGIIKYDDDDKLIAEITDTLTVGKHVMQLYGKS